VVHNIAATHTLPRCGTDLFNLVAALLRRVLCVFAVEWGHRSLVTTDTQSSLSEAPRFLKLGQAMAGIAACVSLSSRVICPIQSGEGIATVVANSKEEVNLKKVFALRGKSNVGKSQTIRTVVEMLNAKHPSATIEHEKATKIDIRVVLTINNLKIGIESKGNPNSRLIKESLDLFVKIGCDLIICATRTSGATVGAVDELAGFDVEWLDQREQSRVTEQVLGNIAMARQIVEKVEVLSESAKAPVARSLAATA
jgi:hypothetical protein